jgi:hypothetical protein
VSGKKKMHMGMKLVGYYRANPKTCVLFDGVKDAHSHWDGNWYQRPTSYPVAYFDPDGYAVFKTEAELLNHGQIRFGETIHIRLSRPLCKLSEWRQLEPPPKSYR